MMLKRCVSFLLVLSLCLTHSGCSLFMPHNETITVKTSEDDADIYVNGNFAGKGTVSTAVRRNSNISIMAKKEGFQPAARNISKTISTTGILDIIGGWLILVPFVGLLAPGAWEPSQTNVSIMMYEKE